MISLLITDLGSHVTIVRRYFRLCDDPRATANSGGSRPSDNGGGGGGERGGALGGNDHPDREMRGAAVSKKFFRPFGPQFGLKIRGAGAGGPGTSPRSANGGPFHTRTDQMSAGQSKNEMSSQSKLQVNERGGWGGMQQPSTYLKPTSFPGPLPLQFFNGQGLPRERG